MRKKKTGKETKSKRDNKQRSLRDYNRNHPKPGDDSIQRSLTAYSLDCQNTRDGKGGNKRTGLVAASLLLVIILLGAYVPSKVADSGTASALDEAAGNPQDNNTETKTETNLKPSLEFTIKPSTIVDGNYILAIGEESLIRWKATYPLKSSITLILPGGLMYLGGDLTVDPMPGKETEYETRVMAAGVGRWHLKVRSIEHSTENESADNICIGTTHGHALNECNLEDKLNA